MNHKPVGWFPGAGEQGSFFISWCSWAGLFLWEQLLVRTKETPSIAQLGQSPQLLPGAGSGSDREGRGDFFSTTQILLPMLPQTFLASPELQLSPLIQTPVAKAFSEHAYREWGPSVHSVKVQHGLCEFLLAFLCSEQAEHKVPGCACLLLGLVPLISS